MPPATDKGVQLGPHMLQGTWSTQQANQSINLLEMEAVLLSVARFLPQFMSRVVHLMCDNAMVVSTSTRKLGQNCSDWPDPTDDGDSQVLGLKGIRLRQFIFQDHATFSDRSVHDFCQQEAACLRITIPGPVDHVRWCDVHPMAWDGNGACLPTIQDVSNCSQQDLQVPQPDVDLGSSVLDVSIVDAEATQVVSQSSHTTGQASTSHSISLVAQSSHWDKDLLTLKSSCLATLNGLVFQVWLQLAHCRTHAHKSETILHWLLWIPLEQIHRVLLEKKPQYVWGRLS